MRQRYIADTVCLEIKRLDFGEVRYQEVCQIGGRYGALGRLPKDQAPAASLFVCSFILITSKGGKN